MKLLYISLVMIALSGCFAKERTSSGQLVGTKMPSFSLLLGDSTTYLSTQNIPSGKPVVFFYYQTWCPHCSELLDNFTKNIDRLKDIHIYMITNSPYSDIKIFSKEHHLEKYPNITMSMDYTNFFADSFKVTGVPYIAIYNDKKELQHTGNSIYPSELLRKAKNSGIHLF
jgi:cytochrome oxidase Cu insertion factor (SCO1/SenC/PrrC family)